MLRHPEINFFASVTKKTARQIAKEPCLAFLPSFIKRLPQASIYLVGGAIRDFLLKKTSKDYDFVIAGLKPHQLEVELKNLGQVDLVGRNFGVYKFQPRDADPQKCEPLDFALPRTEQALPDSRGGYRDFAAQIDETIQIEADLARRDFTINALAFDVVNHRLIDPFNGRNDLKRKLIRCVGNPAERFAEDLSRVLRAIRLAAELNFKIENQTWEALKQAGRQLNTQRLAADGQTEYVVPRETVGAEISRALAANHANALALLFESGLLSQIFPEIQLLLNERKDYLKPVIEASASDPTVIASLIYRDLPADLIKDTLRRNGLAALPQNHKDRIHEDEVAWIAAYLQSAIDPEKLSLSEIEQTFMNGRGERLIQTMSGLHQSDRLAAIERQIKNIRIIWPKQIPKLVTGEDVLAQGLDPSPQIKEILNRIRDAQLAGRVTNREQALSLLKNQTRHR
ncbi:hypothetical protein KJ611_02290 [Patescibacteria group bacterium]|nr:hypothetical protein [Patescibacteria group bacterium]MBU1705573.1 hypothetical protein [Patescibacteria group bacterium]